jgi:UDP-sugar pyrophosphorylase
MTFRDHFPNPTPSIEKALALIESTGQVHLCMKWAKPGQDQELKLKFMEQLLKLDEQYPGGLKTYCDNAKKLLAASKQGDNPYEGCKPCVPNGVSLSPEQLEFKAMETKGLQALASTGFIMVAGGLGERLGYSGIKIALPSETTTNKSFIQVYIENILAYQAKARQATGTHLELPLAIMTSGDTHDMTVNFLSQHKNFGMSPKQLVIMKQEKVPSLVNNQAHFVCEENNPYEIETKPHGHGDVHVLMQLTGTGNKWLSQGIRHVVFFQDTNGVVFNAIPAALGVSVCNEFEVNSITVPRRAGEAAGGIVKLEKNNGESLTINVEYNQLDPLLRATINPNGDVADQTGYSPYPGNINVLVFALQPYMENLAKSGGLIPEFVNPKYADAQKENFKKPTRLECMMQDYPKLLSAEAKVGFTSFPREFCFSAVKNNLVDAAAKSTSQLPPESASSGEMDFYAVHRHKLTLSGAQIETPQPCSFKNIQFIPGPRVVLSGSFASTLEELRSKIANVSISARSTLVIEGDDVHIDGLKLDGKLVIKAEPGAKIKIKNLTVTNQGDELVETQGDEPEEIIIRGYRIVEKESRQILLANGEQTISQ